MALTLGSQLPFGIQPTNPVPVDSWSGPYDGTSSQIAINLANASIPSGVRFLSMEVRLIVNGKSLKYWYKDGITDTDLVEFSTSMSPFYDTGGTTYSSGATKSSWRSGSITIGTSSQSNAKLYVYSTQPGAFRLEDGTQGVGYVLTTDANGISSWTNSFITGASAASTYLTLTGANSYLTIASAASTYLTLTGSNSYLTIGSASSTYLTIGSASSTYLTLTGAASTYLRIASASTPFYNAGSSVFSLDTTSSIYRTGNIGIGTASPSTKLHIYSTQSGVFRLEDGLQGNGYVLTSDTNGVATWQNNPQITVSGATATALASWNNTTVMFNNSATCSVTIPDTGLPPNFVFRFINISTNVNTALVFGTASLSKILPSTLLTFSSYESGIIERLGTSSTYYITY